MLADELDYVIGVDPHRDTHALAVVDVRSGGVVFEATAVADGEGYASVLRLADQHAPGRRAFAVEGTGSFGAGLTRFLVSQEERVLEVGRLRRERRSGKSDALDAIRAARSVLGQTRPARPRAGGEREALRALSAAREGAVTARRAGLCQLRGLLVSAPEPLRAELRSLTRAQLLRRLAAVRPEGRQDPELRGTLLALRALARWVKALTVEERELQKEIETLTRKLAPHSYSTQPGVGPLAAAQILISWSHHGRFPNEAAFARLAGCAPIPASSGQTVRHRLDRGGDRRLNRALHMILVTRRRAHAPTIAYIDRRIQEGKSRREATRCLKRYLARNLYRLLENPPMPT